MDKFFEALEKSKNAITLGLLEQVGFDETAEVLEKGKKAQIGEIRDWKGIKMQKTAQGWVPVKGGSKPEGNQEITQEQQKYLQRFFDPEDWVANVLDYNFKEDESPSFAEFKKMTESDQDRKLGIESIANELNIDKEKAEKLYDEWSAKTLEKVKENPEKYGLKSDEKKTVTITSDNWDKINSTLAEIFSSTDDKERKSKQEELVAYMKKISEK